MTNTKTRQSKTLDRWRNEGNTEGIRLPKGSLLTDSLAIVEETGKPLPPSMGTATDAAYRAIEYKQAAARLKRETAKAVEAAEEQRTEAYALAAMKAARAGDFAKVLEVDETAVADAVADHERADLVVRGFDTANKAAYREFLAEGKSDAGRKWLGAVWADSIVSPYLGDSLKEARAHEARSESLREAVGRLAAVTDPGTQDPQVLAELRNRLRESDSPTLPTIDDIRHDWAQRTAERDAEEAERLAEAKAVNIASGAEAAKHLSAQLTGAPA